MLATHSSLYQGPYVAQPNDVTSSYPVSSCQTACASPVIHGNTYSYQHPSWQQQPQETAMCDPYGPEPSQAHLPRRVMEGSQHGTQKGQNDSMGQSIPIYFSQRGRRPRARQKKAPGQTKSDTRTKDRSGQLNPVGNSINPDVGQTDPNLEDVRGEPQNLDVTGLEPLEQSQLASPNSQ